MTTHPHSPLGYDEPEFLRYSNRQIGLTGTDGGHDTGHQQGAAAPLGAKLFIFAFAKTRQSPRVKGKTA